MSRRRKKRQKNRNQPAADTPKPRVPLSYSNPEEVIRQSQFDAISDAIRGEEILQMEEAKKEKQSREMKKKLDKTEVDRKLEELRDQLGIPKK